MEIQLARLTLGAKDRTPEINSSEIIVMYSGIFQWTFSGIFQHHFMFSCISVAFPQKIVTCPVDVYWNRPMDSFSDVFQWIFIFVRSGVSFN